MKKYYFLSTFLPDLHIGQPPEISSLELEFFLKLNLTDEDFKKMQVLRCLVDIENIRHILKREPLDIGGNYDEKEIENNLLNQEGMPSYIFRFMNSYEDEKTRLQHFTEVVHSYFSEEMSHATGFVRDWLIFEWKLRLTLVVIRAEKLGRDIAKELELENPENPFIDYILSQKGAPFEPQAPFDELKTIYNTKKDNPLELYQALAEWRFDRIEEMVDWNTFGVSRVLAYIVQVDIIEKWLLLDKEKGSKIIEDMMKEVS